jgi:hypothetical protein
MAKFAVTYWQPAQYAITVDGAEILPAVRGYAAEIERCGNAVPANLAQAIADLEAGRVPPADTFRLLASALERDGQVVALSTAQPDEWGAPEDYNVEVLKS